MNKRHFLYISIVLAALIVLPLAKGVDSQQPTLESADQLREEKSFRLAAGKYKAILDSGDLGPEAQREVRFKFADSIWRTHEQVRYEEAAKFLKELIGSDEKDRWWAEASESLADHYLKVNRYQYQKEVKMYYENARDFWAGSKDIDLARGRFIAATFKLGDYINSTWGWHYSDIKPLGVTREMVVVPGQPPRRSGLAVLYKDILKIVKSDEDKVKVYYSLAMSYFQNYGQPDDRKKAIEYFQKVIKEFPTSEWADDVYYQLGRYYQQNNEFPKALKTYREFLTHFRRGESQFVDNAQRSIKDIAAPQLRVNSSYTYLPGSEVQLNMNWRNVNGAKITVYKMDLAKELRFDLSKGEADHNRGLSNYQEMIERIVSTNRYELLPQVLSWHLNLKNEGRHLWHNESKGLAEWRQHGEGQEEGEIDPASGTLEPGAYLVMAAASGIKAYDLILVTDIGIVTKIAGQSALFYVFNAKSGEPRVEAKVKYQYRYYDNRGHRRWSQGEGTTDGTGLLKIAFKTVLENDRSSRKQLFVTASSGAMQTFAQGNYYSHYYGNSSKWNVYAYSDRPAYRPNEEVSFKATMRVGDSGSFRTPSGRMVKVRITDARGNKVYEKAYVLNEFGTFHDKFTLDEKATLGQYNLNIYTEDLKEHLGSATLFRLEEYKLPEFLVNMKPKPKEDGSSAYRLGDVIDVELDAQYYFGGAVAEAEVEYLIYQKPYNHYYSAPRKYHWYFDESFHGRYNYYNQGTLIKKEKIKTDLEGKAFFSFETPEDSQQDLKYSIEVRVVDQSRREIASSQDIKVTRNAFYAYLTPKHNLYRPGDKAEVDIKVLTANDDPVSVDGTITVSRNWWRDRVIKEGKMITHPGYDETELFKKFIKTDEKGEVIFSFEPERDGYYVVKFTAFDDKVNEITSQTNVFVCDKQSKDLGYRYGGIQIITEKDTYSIGETARVMVVADKPGNWVLFSQETNEILGYSLHGLEGTVKLVEFTVADTYTPNVFLSALSVENYQLKMHSIQLIVPPDEKFLNVKLISDKEVYRPQEEGVFDIEVTDVNEQPVAGEISLGIVDASVYYIQQEYAKDIREFFYGTKRRHSVQTNASFYQKQYAKLVRGEKNELIKEDVLKHLADGDKVIKEERTKSDVTRTLNESVGGMRFEASDEIEVSAAMSPQVMTTREGKGSELKRLAKREGEDVRFSSILNGEFGDGGMEAQARGPLKKPTLRRDFRSTVVWQPTIVTDASGRATVKVTFPDSLTTWRATARSITRATDVGNTTHETRTKKDVIVRLQAPRFFTERDEVTVSANIHNYTDETQKIKVTIRAEGLKLDDKEVVWVEIPSQGEERVDWKVKALTQGLARITVAAQGTQDADAMVKSYPVIPHGIEKFIAKSLAVKGSAGAESGKTVTLELPRERVEESTSLKVTLSPSLAAAMLDALPYLAGYPYGCVEQTMSRFLPGVIVKDTMKKLGLSEREVDDYINQVLAPREDPKHPERKGGTTLSQINKMTKTGLDRLYDFQHSDGGWGWWKEGKSDRFMSAYVVWGLSLAKDAGVNVKRNALNRAVRFLQAELVEEENDPDMLAWMLHALGAARSRSRFEDRQIARLWDMREELNPYSRALFALSQHYRGDATKALILARNLANGIVEDKENGTVHWGESGIHYRWSNGGVEATAFAIKALANIMPESEYLEPAVKWMALNRRGARWKNTRDTAIALLGLTDYLKTTDELVPDFDYAVLVNGKEVRAGHVGRENIFTFNRIIELPNAALKDGKNKVEVRMNGAGALYVSGYLKYFTLEENITAAGNEVFVTRKYFIEDTEETLLKGYTTDWRPLASGESVKSGQRVRVEITLDAKNHYEYLVVEDYKPAGLEAVSLKSGSGYAEALDHKGKKSGRTTWIYQEFRDQKAAFFIDKLKQGKHCITYELRAEVPGTFHGMPNMTHAMYVPEIRSNSSEMIVTVE